MLGNGFWGRLGLTFWISDGIAGRKGCEFRNKVWGCEMLEDVGLRGETITPSHQNSQVAIDVPEGII